jgi:hypothetical protein
MVTKPLRYSGSAARTAKNWIMLEKSFSDIVFIEHFNLRDAAFTPLFSRKFLCSLADLALPLVCS